MSSTSKSLLYVSRLWRKHIQTRMEGATFCLLRNAIQKMAKKAKARGCPSYSRNKKPLLTSRDVVARNLPSQALTSIHIFNHSLLGKLAAAVLFQCSCIGTQTYIQAACTSHGYGLASAAAMALCFSMLLQVGHHLNLDRCCKLAMISLSSHKTLLVYRAIISSDASRFLLSHLR